MTPSPFRQPASLLSNLTLKKATATFLALAFVLLALNGCAETPAPPVEAATTAAIPSAETDLTPAIATTTAATTAAPTSKPAAPSPTSATTTPARQAPAEEEAPWPTFLKQLDFSIPAGNSYGPRALALHAGLGRIYVRTHRQAGQGPGLVAVLDAADGRVLAVVETGLDNYAEGGLALDAARDRLYAVNPGDSTATVLDAGTMETLATLDGVDRLALDATGGRLYVAGLAGLRVLVVEGYGVQQEVSLTTDPRFLALAAAPDQGRVYLASQDQGGYRLDIYRAGTLESAGSRSLPGPIDTMLPDPARERLYLTLNDGERALFWALDDSGQLLEEQVLGDWTGHTTLALDPAGDRLFLGRDAYKNYGVTVLDLATLEELDDLPLEAGPQALVWDAGAGRLLASHTYENRVVALEPRAGGATASYPTALNLVDVAVDSLQGRLYVSDSAGRLHALEGETGQEGAVVEAGGLIAVDATHGRLYTGGEGADEVRIFSLDPLEERGQIRSKARPVADVYSGGLLLARSGIRLASLQTLTITGAISDTLSDPVGFSPNPAAVDAVVDPGSGRLLAIVNNGVPGSNNGNYLYVYERQGEDDFRRILTDTERSVAYVDVDGSSGRAYVARRYMNLHATGLLVDGREYTARIDALSGPLRVDPGLGRLYLSVAGEEEGYLLILDAESLDLLAALPIDGGYGLAALDTERHLLYLARREGQVQIWSATGGTLPAPVTPERADLPADQVARLYVGPDGSPLLAGSLYLSTDGGQQWLYIAAGLPRRAVAHVAVSPDYDRDQTLFAALAATDEGLGIWRSDNGGRSWRLASAGLSDLAVVDLAISPEFGQDATLFATTRKQGLFRSTDGGAHWTRLTERYFEPAGYNEPPSLVALSPTYGRDHTLFVVHDGLQRSTDGGESWTTLMPEVPGSLALSPDFAADGTLYGWFGSAGVLRSTDRGETWQPASRGLALSSYGTGRLLLAPAAAGDGQALYFIWSVSVPDRTAQVYRSIDGGQTWQQPAGETPEGLGAAQLSPAGDALLILDGAGRLVRWPVEEFDWQPVAAPPVAEVQFYDLAFGPDFADGGALYAASQGADVYRSDDAGLTWQPTGYPLRPGSVEPQPLLVLPGEDGGHALLLGSELGLYRYDGGPGATAPGTWQAVEGGLPAGRAATTPWTGGDGSLRLLSGAPEEEQRVFLSTDGGGRWTSPLPPLPAPAIVEDVWLSPGLAEDGTAFFTGAGNRPLRSVEGGPWREIGPPGEWLLSAFQMSPTFDRDGLLFLRTEGHALWRSTDGGDHWQMPDGPWGQEPATGITPGRGGYRLPAVTFSPDYASDGVLLTQVGSGLYRSTDEGATWTQVLALGSRFVQAMFSPGYAREGIVYLRQGATLYRSADGGASWQPLPPPPWGEGDEIQMILSPTFDEDHTLLAWSLSGTMRISRDGGQSWQGADEGLPGAAIRRPVFSPDHAADGLIYLLPHAVGLYKWTGDGPWVPVTEAIALAPRPTPTPTPLPPRPTPTPAVCASEPARFRAVWQQVRGRLGCPEAEAEALMLAEQPFEHGRMIWVSTEARIYVLHDSGHWQAFADTWREGVDPAYDPALPPPPQQPQRGFGKVWRQELGGPEAEIGWATAAERAVDGWRQPFEAGLLLWTDTVPAGASEAGTAYVLFDDGTWQAVPAPRP
ncbi:MAG: hypothetical protein P8129_01415 [Anaerolineae bacterium]